MISILAQAAGASSATGYVIGGGIVGAVIAIAKIIEWSKPKLRSGNGCNFTPTESERVKELLEFHGRTDAEGVPLCYPPRGLTTAIREQTEVMRQLSATIRQQHELVSRRIAVCEKHTDTLLELRGEMRRGKGS